MHRRMPLGYLAVWVGLFLLLVLYQSGWPGALAGAWTEVLCSALVGGGFFGWLSWRLYAYKKFPPR